MVGIACWLVQVFMPWSALTRLTRPPTTTSAATPTAMTPASFRRPLETWVTTGVVASCGAASCGVASGIGFSGSRRRGGRGGMRAAAVDQAEDDGNEHQGGDG